MSRGRFSLVFVLASITCGMVVPTVFAGSGSLSIDPAAAVYPVGEPFSVAVRIDTGGGTVGSVDASLAYDLSDVSFVSVSDEGSVFSTVLVDSNREPGRVDISGIITRGAPGYSGANGLVARVTFVPLRPVATQVRIAGGSAKSTLSLTAAVAQSDDFIASLQNATYTLVPRNTTPPLGAGVGDVASTFPITADPVLPSGGWYATSSVKLSWELPADVDEMRGEVSSDQRTAPTKTYRVPVSSVQVDGLRDGAQWFLLQFHTEAGWGDVLPYPLHVDRTPPDAVTVEETERKDQSDPRVAFRIGATDAASGVATYSIAVDDTPPTVWQPEENDAHFEPNNISPGEHTLVVTVEDRAGNATSTVHAFYVKSIEPPVLTDAPDRVLTGNAITVKGTSYPGSQVTVFTSFNDGESTQRQVTTDAQGVFVATVTDAAREGKYTVWFSVVDERGATSPLSIKRSVQVSEPYIMLFGKKAVTYMSIIVPLMALIVLLALTLWLAFMWVHGYRRRVRRETQEAYTVAQQEFESLREELVRQIGDLERANQSRELTKEEMRIFDELSRRLDHMEGHITDEIDDIERVSPRDHGPAQVVTHRTLTAYQERLQTAQASNQTPPRQQPTGSHTIRIERRG